LIVHFKMTDQEKAVKERVAFQSEFLVGWIFASHEGRGCRAVKASSLSDLLTVIQRFALCCFEVRKIRGGDRRVGRRGRNDR